MTGPVAFSISPPQYVPLPLKSKRVAAAAADSHCQKDISADESSPVIDGARFAYEKTDLVKVNDDGILSAAKLIHDKMHSTSYSPRTWRTHPLHILPHEPYDSTHPSNKRVLDWIFLISALNFSFWSEYEGSEERFGVEWYESWDSEKKTVWTGYWSLVAALNRATHDDDIPITDPRFYSSPDQCPDSLIAHVFRRSATSTEDIPLLAERIRIMREVGSILCNNFDGSFANLVSRTPGSALDLVKMVVKTFPSFRDQHDYEGRTICIWKRAQILVAEAWAAFYPALSSEPHPLFKSPKIYQLTMFADYRLPQILHHLSILSYPPSLLSLLENQVHLPSGSREELSLRSASIVGVDMLRQKIMRIYGEDVSSVVLDFFLWDLAKRVEDGSESVAARQLVPIHRTRSIWY